MSLPTELTDDPDGTAKFRAMLSSGVQICNGLYLRDNDDGTVMVSAGASVWSLTPAETEALSRYARRCVCRLRNQKIDAIQTAREKLEAQLKELAEQEKELMRPFLFPHLEMAT